ncbi:MAG: GNAT family N-acetyltransferase [Planctomycetota bacterium]
MANVTEINDLQSLANYEMAWNALAPLTPRYSFFHTYDWTRLFWEHFGGEQQLRVLIVEAAGKVIGVVPLCTRIEQRRWGSVRVLTYPLDGWGMYFSPVGGMQAATLRLAMQHIADTAEDRSAPSWDLINLPWIDRDGTDRGRTERALGNAGLTSIAKENEANSVIEFTGDWESYLADRPRKVRHEIRRNLRRTAEAGRVEYVRHRPAPQREGDGDPRWDLYDECEEVARHSWQAGLTKGNTLCHDRVRQFLRKAHAAASRQGMVDMNVLRIDGQAVAFNYNYHSEGSVFGLRMGYREDHPVKGAGTALISMTLQDSCRRGDERFELGPGNQYYKQRLRTCVEHNWRVTHTPLTSWRSQALRLSEWTHTLMGHRKDDAAYGKGGE